ncbi:MAG: Gfo/Idh/MocA family oxidoreductase, partial [Saprospiraceae bacterium]|nr:Gfo/Idh/MocA family oxidoreductase [Saprospiraceae bacterium]
MKKSTEKTTGNSGLKRREFIKNSAMAAGTFMIVPRFVLGGSGYVSPSDKLNIACIGAGGKGWSDISNAYNNGGDNVVAICDIDRNMAKRAIEKWPAAKYYNDFRKMLEGDEKIDAVTISSPDHTHAVAAMAAMQLGIH